VGLAGTPTEFSTALALALGTSAEGPVAGNTGPDSTIEGAAGSTRLGTARALGFDVG
jgi:hypothetical protein